MARSSSRTSQALRHSPDNLGRGIRPSLTIPSKVLGETQIYAAAASRLIKRGPSVGGSASCRGIRLLGAGRRAFSWELSLDGAEASRCRSVPFRRPDNVIRHKTDRPMRGEGHLGGPEAPAHVSALIGHDMAPVAADLAYVAKDEMCHAFSESEAELRLHSFAG
jgi:hypothetical protein